MKFHQINCKMCMEKILNEGNQIHKFVSSSGSVIVINYGSGSACQNVPVPVPIHNTDNTDILKVWWPYATLFVYIFIFLLQYIYSYNHTIIHS